MGPSWVGDITTIWKSVNTEHRVPSPIFPRSYFLRDVAKKNKPEIATEVDDPLSKAISRFNIDGVPKIAYHPAVARRWNATWQFMSDFDIPVVLFCDDLDNNQGAPDRDGQGSYYPDLLKIEPVAIDGQVIKNEYCSAYHDPSLIYENRLIYRTCGAEVGIHDFPFIDIFYTDFRFGLPTPNADRIPRCEEYDTWDEEYDMKVKDEVVREIVEYCYHIKDGGLLIVENWIMNDLERRIPNIRFEVDGRRASNRFGRISIEYLGEYRLKTGDFNYERDKVEVFKIHSEVKFENPTNFLAKCFVDINWG